MKPKWTPTGPVYSELSTFRTGTSPLYPLTGTFGGAANIPLSYRCASCLIYWLGPDEPRPSP